MTFDELLAKLLEVCPRGSMGEDLDGQLVFYTDLREVGSEGDEPSKVEPFEPEPENPGVST